MRGRDVGVEWDVRYRAMIHEVGEAVVAACADLGLGAERVTSQADEKRYDRVLLVNLQADRWRDLVQRPPAPRTLWYAEPLPSPTSALGNVLRSFPSARLLDSVIRAVPPRARPNTLLGLRAAAAAEREPVRNLATLRRVVSSIDGLVTSTRPFESLAGYPRPWSYAVWGYHPQLAGSFVDPARDRDIPVLVLATNKDPYGRRETALATLRAQLEPEIPVLRISQGLRGEERHELLSRTRVVVDLHRIPGNFGPVRLVLAGAAGAVVASEPYASTLPFVRDIHHVEAPLAELGATVRRLLHEEDRRRAIATAAQELLEGPASMAYNLRLVLGPLLS